MSDDSIKEGAKTDPEPEPTDAHRLSPADEQAEAEALVHQFEAVSKSPTKRPIAQATISYRDEKRRGEYRQKTHPITSDNLAEGVKTGFFILLGGLWIASQIFLFGLSCWLALKFFLWVVD